MVTHSGSEWTETSRSASVSRPVAIILAGGRGERLRPYTDDRPKPMIEVNGVPLIAYLLHPIVILAISVLGMREQLVGYKDSSESWVVILGSTAMALLVCALTGMIAKAGLRIRI